MRITQRFAEFGDSCEGFAETPAAAEAVAAQVVDDLIEAFFSPRNGVGDWRQDGADMVYTPAPDYEPCRVGDAAYWEMWDEISQEMEEVRPAAPGDGGEWRIRRAVLADILRRYAVVVEVEDD